MNDPPVFETPNYNECEIFKLDDEKEYAVFYDGSTAESSGLESMTETEIINQIRIGRNLQHDTNETVEKMEKEELRIIYIDSAASMQMYDIQDKLLTEDIFLLTNVRAIDIHTWSLFAKDLFGVLHLPCFKKGPGCAGFGGVTILYRKNLRVVNNGRIFTWKLLNTENGKIYPGVEGVYIDVTNETNTKVNRICTMYHWRHENSKGYDPMVNVINFTSHFLTKTIPPADDLPVVVHIFGRFNFPAEEFSPKLKEKHPELELIRVAHDDIYALSTDPSLFTTSESEPNDVFSFVVKFVS